MDLYAIKQDLFARGLCIVARRRHHIMIEGIDGVVAHLYKDYEGEVSSIVNVHPLKDIELLIVLKGIVADMSAIVRNNGWGSTIRLISRA
jgi:hypothetical protein